MRKNNKSKKFTQFIAGIFGGTILGIPGFINMMNYGGNYEECFITTGYGPCGSFGAITGILLGAILGIAILSKAKITKNSKVAIIWAS